MEDVTSLVVWTSSDEAVAAVSNDPETMGLLTAVAPGSATLNATLGDVSVTTTVQVY